MARPLSGIGTEKRTGGAGGAGAGAGAGASGAAKAPARAKTTAGPRSPGRRSENGAVSGGGGGGGMGPPPRRRSSKAVGLHEGTTARESDQAPASPEALDTASRSAATRLRDGNASASSSERRHQRRHTVAAVMTDVELQPLTGARVPAQTSWRRAPRGPFRARNPLTRPVWLVGASGSLVRQAQGWRRPTAARSMPPCQRWPALAQRPARRGHRCGCRCGPVPGSVRTAPLKVRAVVVAGRERARHARVGLDHHQRRPVERPLPLVHEQAHAGGHGPASAERARAGRRWL